jgi:NAD(P)-dependent dehydrogenase (short-subunit alcohol dehydrogenase family)
LLDFSNVGIGYATAQILLLQGCTIILACRDVKKAQKARDGLLFQLQLHKPDLWFDKGAERVIVIEDKCDLADLDAVRRYASAIIDKLQASSKGIDYLINNAGMLPNTYQLSPQGFELTYASNMLGSFLLTSLLLPSMKQDGRIIQTSSAAVYFALKVREDDLNGERFLLRGWQKKHEGQPMNYLRSMAVYSQSKAMQAVFTLSLQDKLLTCSEYAGKDITVHACHPGLVTSTLWNRSDVSSSARSLYRLFTYLTSFVIYKFGIREQEAAVNLVYLATAEKPAQLEYRGKFWDRLHTKYLPASILDQAGRNKVWKRWELDAGLSKDEKLV